MKTQIIHLESHDDTNSVKDKMDWSQTPRVLLIWPEKTRVLADRLDLVLLERHCTAMGSQLALVTSHPDVQYHARVAGIPTFNAKEKAQSRPWHRSDRFYRRRQVQRTLLTPKEVDLSDRPPQRPYPEIDLPYWGELTVFTIAVFAVLAIATLFLPRTQITFPPQRRWDEITLRMQSGPGIRESHISGTVPTTERSLSVEKRDQIPASGKVALPETYASGTVEITNLTDHEIHLPKNTVLTTSGSPPVKYKTRSKVTVPAGINQQTEVEVIALQPGSTGNQPAGVISGISATVGADLTVNNPEPIQGGKGSYVKIPTERDREYLTDRVLDALTKSALENIKATLGPNDLLISDAPIVREIESKTFRPAKGEPGESLTLIMRVQFAAWVVQGDDLMDFAQGVIQTSQRREHFQPVTESITLIHETPPSLSDEGTATWTMKLRWQNEPTIAKQDVIHRVLGQPPRRAQEQLSQAYDLDPPPQIKIRPPWWPRLPFLPFRIEVN